MTALLFFATALLTPLSVADSTHAYYAVKDTAALTAMLNEADTREADLLCRYRLYPLTQEAALIESLPDELDDATARELALLAGLWGYRTARASFTRAIRYGLRTERIMEQALALDPDDPFVLLIEGQSLLFKPRIAGGNAEEALDRFKKLRAIVSENPEAGIALLEADLWIWYALRKLDREEAAPMQREMLARVDLPILYREFLLDPP